MKTSATDPFQRLTTLNAMVSLAAGTDPESTGQMHAAIEFCRESKATGSEDQSDAPIDYRELVRRLVRFHIQHRESFGFRLWDLSEETYEPLWVRAHLMRELRRLAGCEQALLLICGLRDAICPPGRYWTQARAEEHRRALSYIETLSLQFKTPRTRLSILFIESLAD